MCNFYIYGKIPMERKDFTIKIVDVKTKQIKESTISKILQDNKIKNKDIQELMIFVSNNPFKISDIDINLYSQTINGNEIKKIYNITDSEYEYFDNEDILIKNKMYTHSVLNNIISSHYNYFALYIKYTDTRKIKIKKINDKIVGDETV